MLVTYSMWIRAVQEQSSSQSVQVAVKMLKENHSDSDLADLVKEMEILKAIGNHPNVVNLIGKSNQIFTIL